MTERKMRNLLALGAVAVVVACVGGDTGAVSSAPFCQQVLPAVEISPRGTTPEVLR